MGLQSFESGLERMVDGVFSRGSRPALRPVEIGRRLLREVDEHRSVDVKGRRIVPNTYTVAVSQRDLDSFEPYFDQLCDELARTVREYARSEGWSLEEGIVKSGSFNIDQGVGVRAISGDKTAFAYSDDISMASLLDAARTVRSIA